MNIINVLNNDNYILIDFCWFVGRFDINSNSKSNSNGNSDINASTDDICVNEQRIINLIKNNTNNNNTNINEIKKIREVVFRFVSLQNCNLQPTKSIIKSIRL